MDEVHINHYKKGDDLSHPFALDSAAAKILGKNKIIKSGKNIN